ncbi:hypothetical protein TCAL_08812 [Tigriopus californicus]|uniref:Uncharacterized protein n=1 Tax=Tigriopus californicus TaxID=6832 RepID=A0A553PTC5_TIGCA|nr:protein rolling stone-like [Tigriopus californicus]TRY80930.1 hypothetical protein TCAL_08812 [Tigriopus californicus]|eukprot:TCALIF_08812-PA protein Name:"Similar to rost Protein rolling stone (Drosophila melanogaster)" AED:0.01 eAED:0.02 QI:0/-1/0/1/-1/1/1/0/206
MSAYVLFRLVSTIFFDIGFVALLRTDLRSLYKGQIWKFFIYFTNWGLLLLITRINCQCFEILGDPVRLPPWFLPKLISLSNVTSLVISVAFWLLVYEGQAKYQQRWFFNQFEHSFTSAFCLVDTVVNPLRKSDLDWTLPVLIGISYLIFTIIFELLGLSNAEGDNFIYAIIQWKKNPKKTALTWIVIFMAMILTHAFFMSLNAVIK